MTLLASAAALAFIVLSVLYFACALIQCLVEMELAALREQREFYDYKENK